MALNASGSQVPACDAMSVSDGSDGKGCMRIRLPFDTIEGKHDKFSAMFINAAKQALNLDDDTISVDGLREGSIIIDFEVSQGGEGQPSSADILKEIEKQLADPNSALRTGEFAQFAEMASLVHQVPQEPEATEAAEEATQENFAEPIPAAPTFTAPVLADADSATVPSLPPLAAPAPAVPTAVPAVAATTAAPAADVFTSTTTAADVIASTMPEIAKQQVATEPLQLLSTDELQGRIRMIESRMQPPTQPSISEQEKSVYKEAELETSGRNLEAELNQSRKKAAEYQAQVDRLEIRLAEKDTMIAHAKENWLRESSRATTLAEKLNSAENQIADLQKQLVMLAGKQDGSESRLRQLEFLLKESDAPRTLPTLSPEAQVAALPMGVSPFVSNSPSAAFTATESVPATAIRQPTLIQPTRSNDSVQSSVLRQASPYAAPSGISAVPYSASQPQLRAVMSPSPSWDQRVPRPVPVAANTIFEKFRTLAICNDAVLYEDSLLQIGVKSSFFGAEGQMDLFVGNKSNGSLANFRLTHSVPEPNALLLSAGRIEPSIKAKKQICQSIKLAVTAPFIAPPVVEVQCLMQDNTPAPQLVLTLPVTINKFMEALEFKEEEFGRIWKNREFQLNESSAVVNLDSRFTSWKQRQRAMSLGGALHLHEFQNETDTDAFSFSLAGQFPRRDVSADSDVRSLTVLVRVEVGANSNAGKAKVRVRSDSSDFAASVKEAITTQIGLHVANVM